MDCKLSMKSKLTHPDAFGTPDADWEYCTVQLGKSGRDQSQTYAGGKTRFQFLSIHLQKLQRIWMLNTNACLLTQIICSVYFSKHCQRHSPYAQLKTDNSLLALAMGG